MVRGVARAPVFRDQRDYRRYLATARTVLDLTDARVLAYALMPNHAHFLIEADLANLTAFFRRLGTRYAGYFNKRHDRVGHLFQDRFKSKPVETDAYLTTAVAYIHLNPVRAGLARDVLSYPWSSRAAWRRPDGLTDVDRLTELVGMAALRQAEADAVASPEAVPDPFAARRPGRPPASEMGTVPFSSSPNLGAG
jgi:REP element-mobilizing transposase RayT